MVMADDEDSDFVANALESQRARTTHYLVNIRTDLRAAPTAQGPTDTGTDTGNFLMKDKPH
jgi:hypothetical protein